MNFYAYLLVFVGGGLGSLCRYLVGKVLNANQIFPYGTFVVNAVGCFILGCLIGYLSKEDRLYQNVFLVVVTGFCGGFTTFSTFTYEYINLIRGDNLKIGIIYLVFSIVIGAVSLVVGIYLQHILSVKRF